MTWEEAIAAYPYGTFREKDLTAVCKMKNPGGGRHFILMHAPSRRDLNS